MFGMVYYSVQINKRPYEMDKHEECEENKLMRDLMQSSASSFQLVEEQTFDPFEEHCCKGGATETWLVPGGSEFWLIFRGDYERFTWIEYCPYCGYRPPNLRWDWGNPKIPDPPPILAK
jgi:hypothetical protein